MNGRPDSIPFAYVARWTTDSGERFETAPQPTAVAASEQYLLLITEHDVPPAAIGPHIVRIENTSAPTATERHRPLREIALDIVANWKRPYYGAVPYLEALSELDQVTDHYFYEPAENIIRYFLANASTWRGETARRIKAELKDLL